MDERASTASPQAQEHSPQLEPETRDIVEFRFRTCLMVAQDLLYLVEEIKSHQTDGRDVSLKYLDDLEYAVPLANSLHEIEIAGRESQKRGSEELFNYARKLLFNKPVVEQMDRRDFLGSVDLSTFSDEDLKSQMKPFHHDAKYIETWADLYRAYIRLPSYSDDGISREVLEKMRSKLRSIQLVEAFVGAHSESVLEVQQQAIRALEAIETHLLDTVFKSREDFQTDVSNIEAAASNLLNSVEKVTKQATPQQISDWITSIVQASSNSLPIEWTPPSADSLPTGTVPIDKYSLIAYLQRNILDNAHKAYKVRPDRAQRGISISLNSDDSNLYIKVSDFGSGFSTQKDIPANQTGSVMYDPIQLETLQSGWKDESGASVADSEGIGLLGVRNRLRADGGDLKIYNRINSIENSDTEGRIDGAELEIILPITQ